MSTYQLANDTTGRLVVEWSKYPPHFQIVIDSYECRTYTSEESAMRAAKRLCRKLGLTLAERFTPQHHMQTDSAVAQLREKIARQELKIARTADATLKRVAREDLQTMLRELNQQTKEGN
jgi:carboxylesterase type B